MSTYLEDEYLAGLGLYFLTIELIFTPKGGENGS